MLNKLKICELLHFRLQKKGANITVGSSSQYAIFCAGQRCGDSYTPIQLVAPRAVRIAVAIDAIICTINFTVSFLLITQFFNFYLFTFLLFYLFTFKIGRGLSPNP